MEPVFREWGGVEQAFALDLGRIRELEDACGKTGVGAIFLRLGRHEHTVDDIYHTLRLGLIGGGMSQIEARRVMTRHFDTTPYELSASVALDVLTALYAGIDAVEGETGDPAEPLPFGEIGANFLKAGVSPDILNRMDYADFVQIMRALRDDVQPPSEDEYIQMLERLNNDH